VTDRVRTFTRRETIAWAIRAGFIAGIAPNLAIAGSALGNEPATGYGSDPDLVNPELFWPLTLSPRQRRALEQLADVLLTADDHGPAPSAVGIGAFFDEWLSAPYPEQHAHREVLIPWIDQFAKRFVASSDEREIAAWMKDSDQVRTDAFAVFKRLCLVGYYTTEQGMQDLGYVIPSPSSRFPGPPQDVLEKLGLKSS
jgi:hypothetical protein